MPREKELDSSFSSSQFLRVLHRVQSSCTAITLITIRDVLRDLLPFVQFKKRKKHPWRSITFSKVAGSACNFTKSNIPPWVFFMFFKLCKWYQIVQRITYEK